MRSVARVWWSMVGLAALVGTTAIAADGAATARVDDEVVGPTVDDVAYDMFGAPYRTDGRWKGDIQIGAAPWGAHEAVPAGARTNWDWYHGARYGADGPWDDHVIPWGQAFAAEGNDEWDVRLQVREVHLMYLDGSGVWREIAGDVRDSAMQGAFWDDRFRGQGSSDAEEGIRDESGNGGGWSVRLSSMRNKPNYVTWHWFYPKDFYPRPAVPDDAVAIFSAAQMRLITDGGDPADADFIASFGADNWPVATGGKPSGSQITAMYQPRMKRVEEEWRWFTGHTFAAWFDASGAPIDARVGAELIRQNPPPIVVGGSTGRPLVRPVGDQMDGGADIELDDIVGPASGGDDARELHASARRVGAVRGS